MTFGHSQVFHRSTECTGPVWKGTRCGEDFSIFLSESAQTFSPFTRFGPIRVSSIEERRSLVHMALWLALCGFTSADEGAHKLAIHIRPFGLAKRGERSALPAVRYVLQRIAARHLHLDVREPRGKEQVAIGLFLQGARDTPGPGFHV